METAKAMVLHDVFPEVHPCALTCHAAAASSWTLDAVYRVLGYCPDLTVRNPGTLQLPPTLCDDNTDSWHISRIGPLIDAIRIRFCNASDTNKVRKYLDRHMF